MRSGIDMCIRMHIYVCIYMCMFMYIQICILHVDLDAHVYLSVRVPRHILAQLLLHCMYVHMFMYM